jgi:hypothetical protein
MLKNDYPMFFNQTEIPFPSTWSEDSNTVESTWMSEAGTDKINVSRYDKLKINMAFNCLDAVVEILGGFSNMDSFQFKRYNPRTAGYETRNVRMRNFKTTFKKKSEDLSISNGIWNVSFSLEEF